jgi:fimbrial chaperone protein
MIIFKTKKLMSNQLFLKEILLTLSISLTLVLLLVNASWSGDWRVTPIHLTFDRGARSAVLTINNNADSEMSFNVNAMLWTQTAAGEDTFTATDDLIYFPKSLLVPPKQERIIRIGLKKPAILKEQSFRIFIEEADSPSSPSDSATKVTIRLRFSIPIFVVPEKEILTGEIYDIQLYNNNLHVTVKNSGNAHFKISSINAIGKNADGEPIYTQNTRGWYLLAGTKKSYELQIPEDVCSQIKKINVQVEADRIDINEEINVSPSMCATQ